ncbi:MAG: hypothetical protein P1P77_08610 [Spirochaetaceae bacterium]|nr:hypothetical protein [Spirochaetaceae bacterium]
MMNPPVSEAEIPSQFPLDNAAQIFVNIVSEGETTLSRINLIMTEPVDTERLQNVVTEVVVQRFPYYQVYLKKSRFAYVLERTHDIPQVESDPHYTNRYVDFHENEFLFRFRTAGKNIAVELSHILSDGFGAMVLLLSVVAAYLEKGGIVVEDSPMIFKAGEDIHPTEWECGYTEMFNPKGPAMKVGRSAYIPSGRPIDFKEYYTARYNMSLDEVRQKARIRNVTVAVFMSGIYFWAIQQLYLEDIEAGKTRWGRPLRLQIPVNLRKDHPTRTMKNFSYIYSPEFTISKPQDALDVDKIIQLIAEDIRYERHHQTVENQIRRNLRMTARPLFRFMPRGIKERVLSLFYHIFARSLYSGVLTNLGEVRLPDAMREHVDSVDILACNSPAPGRNTSIFSYKGRLEVNFGSSMDDLRLEKAFEAKLKDMGIDFDTAYKRS